MFHDLESDLCETRPFDVFGMPSSAFGIVANRLSVGLSLSNRKDVWMYVAVFLSAHLGTSRGGANPPAQVTISNSRLENVQLGVFAMITSVKDASLPEMVSGLCRTLLSKPMVR